MLVNVVNIGGIDIAIEVKFCKDWSKSLRNPASSIGTKPFSIAEQEKMILQARKYSDGFKDGKIQYYTNSKELAEYYMERFKSYNITNIEFVIVK